MSCHNHSLLASTLVGGAILFLLIAFVYTSEAFGQGGESEIVSRNDPDRAHPISSWIKQLRKSALNPAIAESHQLASEPAAVCPPTGLESRQVAEAAGSGTRGACMQVCMRRQSFNDSNAVLLCRNRCR